MSEKSLNRGIRVTGAAPPSQGSVGPGTAKRSGRRIEGPMPTPSHLLERRIWIPPRFGGGMGVLNNNRLALGVTVGSMGGVFVFCRRSLICNKQQTAFIAGSVLIGAHMVSCLV